MEAAQSVESDDAMWQGYVSAISCLLLALLLLMAILSIALMMASSAPKATPVPRAQSSAAASPLVPMAGASKPDRQAKGARWVINFPGQTVAIGQNQRAQFGGQLVGVKPTSVWQVFAYSEPGNSTSQRLAYMRVLATRDLLIDSGIAVANIELQLLETDAAPSSNKTANTTDGLVYVKPSVNPDLAGSRGRVTP